MDIQSRTQIDIRNYLPVNDDERLSIKQITSIVERSASAQNLGLVHIIEVDAEFAAVAQRSSHRVRPVMQVDNHIANVEAREVLGNVTDEWLA